MNNGMWITIIGFYTLALIALLHYYEEKINKLSRELAELASNLDKVFEENIRLLKAQPVQYESSGWAGSSEAFSPTIHIDTNPYIQDVLFETMENFE